MISRRNIRVKVMQTLYVLDAQENPVPPAEAVKLLKKQFDHSTELFVFLIHTLTEVARYAETDARHRASKHLPTAEDLKVNTRIAGNELLWTILEQPSYQAATDQYRPHLRLDPEVSKKLYVDLVESDTYKNYVQLPSREKKSERDILEFIFNDIMLPSEAFEGHIEDLFNNWDDDVDMMHQMMMHFLQKPASLNFKDMLGDEKWNFAKGLLETVREKKTVTMELIKPKLKNWDADRIALLDMILMQMGVCEFLFFETIPPKVTINEYIDLAKEYSTPQSGQFVNGLLDNIHKDLVKEDKLRKVAYKKAD